MKIQDCLITYAGLAYAKRTLKLLVERYEKPYCLVFAGTKSNHGDENG